MVTTRTLLSAGLVIITIVSLLSVIVVQQNALVSLARSAKTETLTQAFYFTIRLQTTSTMTIQQAPLAASPTSFLGDWRNIDPNTRGNVRVQISQLGGLYQIRIWGQCHPDPCDWGNVALNFYGRGVEGGDRYYALAVYQFGFETVHVTLSFVSGGTLQVTTFTHFTDASGRADYFMIEAFNRA